MPKQSNASIQARCANYVSAKTAEFEGVGRLHNAISHSLSSH